MISGFNWGKEDYIVVGLLLGGTIAAIALVIKFVPKKFRLYMAIGILALLVVTWIHLAVGIVDTWPLAGS